MYHIREVFHKRTAVRGTNPEDRDSLLLSLFFRQCALAALKDVHKYLSREEGHVAVNTFPFSPSGYLSV
jgi:hypothetical protein